jgi:DNA helicase-2/ATP-dependent DNA helicase PcrA
VEKQQEHLKGLNAPQLEAALHTKGPLLIVAGAGAGKTKTITHRILHLIKEGVVPERILAVTFTNKAAKEMRDRIREAVSHLGSLGRNDGDGQRKFFAKNFRADEMRNREPFVSTFHSLGLHIIKENARLLGHTRYFTILDESDAASLIKEALKELEIDPKQYDPKRIRNIISREKGKFVHPEEYAASAEGTIGKIVARVWNIYERKKMKENALDFDDLLLKAVRLLKENAEVRKVYQERWEYIHIDEYQDTNEVQYLLSKLLCERSKNICAVGDADQNIYSWRGANLKNILSFEKDYPDAKIIMLEENYRSTQNILEAANEIIRKNKMRPDRNLFTKNKAGEKIGFYEALDETDEAEFVATKILEIADRGGNIFSGIAVLYRANFQSRALEEALLRYNIPYQVLGVRFFERKEIKDTLAYLRAALNPDSLSDIKRIMNFPARGIGKATLAKIFAGQKDALPGKTLLKVNGFFQLLAEISEKIKNSKASDTVKYVVKKSGIERELLAGGDEDIERLENIKELATLALKYDNLTNGKGVEKLLEDASLSSDQDDLMIGQEKREAKKEGGVKLMTVHASKGLEFRDVFITGLESGLFPHERLGERDGNSDQEEERRLFYVALTRAKEKLFLSFANFRTIFGSRSINTPSEFIADIPADLLEREGENGRIKTIYL